MIKDRNEKERKESKYSYLLSEMERANSERSYKSIASEFATISGYKDSDSLKKQCLEKAEECRKEEEILRIKEERREKIDKIIRNIIAVSGVLILFAAIIISIITL